MQTSAKLFTAIGLISMVWIVNAQSPIRLRGIIRDAKSNEPLIGANIVTQNQNTGSITNTDGYFILVLNAPPKFICASYVGYKSDTLHYNHTKDTFFNVFLEPSLLLSEVTIQGNQQSRAGANLGVTSLSSKQIEQVPALLGETDAMRVLALTPGVQGGAEGNTGLHVRGGSPDQNLLLLDGTVVYNAAHLFGFLSVFNPDAIKNVKLIREGFPAQYGGRLSSIVEVSMKEGNKKEHHKKLSIGLISSRLFMEGPVSKQGKTSYMLAARASYLSLISLPAYIQYHNGSRKDFQSLWMYDANLKFTHEFSTKTKLALSVFNAQDHWGSYFNTNSEKSEFSLKWGNRTAALRLTHQSGRDKFVQSVLSYNNYSYHNNNKSLDGKNQTISNIINQAKIQDIAWNNTLQWNQGSTAYLYTGFELRHQTVNPNFSTSTGENPIQILPKATQFVNTAVVFLGQKIESKNGFFVDAGFRYSLYLLNEKTQNFFEPRLKMGKEWDAGNQAIQISVSKMSQALHLLATSGTGLPNDVWVAANNRFPAESSLQYSLGYTWQNANQSIKWSAETYYKSIKNLIDYRPGLNLYEIPNQDWENLVDGSGLGRSYGLELSLYKQTERFSGWIAYTLSKTERKISTVNSNAWYPYRYDRRHDLAITGSYQLNEKWKLGANFEFQTGAAVTLPVAAQLDIDDYPIFVFEGRNNARMPSYHRLDVSFTKEKTTQKNRKVLWSYGVYNVYGRLNPYYLDYRLGYIRPPDSNFYNQLSPIGFYSNFWQRSILRFVPFISYQINY